MGSGAMGWCSRAIRPAGDSFRSPDQVAREVSPDEARLYDLVWKRTIAEFVEDTVQYSIMSYFSETNTGAIKHWYEYSFATPEELANLKKVDEEIAAKKQAAAASQPAWRKRRRYGLRAWP